MSSYRETTGYLIHQRKYRDSSLICEFFCKDTGRLNLIAKGISKNNSLKSQLKPFCLLKIQYFGKSDLKTLSNCNVIVNRHFQNLKNKTTGLYLNELLRYSLIENDTVQELFTIYDSALNQVGVEKLSKLLRRYELAILKQNGFQLSPESYKLSDWVTIQENKGVYVSESETSESCLASDLIKLHNFENLEKTELIRVNRFMHKAIDICFSNRTIYSRELLKTL